MSKKSNCFITGVRNVLYVYKYVVITTCYYIQFHYVSQFVSQIFLFLSYNSILSRASVVMTPAFLPLCVSILTMKMHS